MNARFLIIGLIVLCHCAGGLSQSTQHEKRLTEVFISADSIRKNLNACHCVKFLKHKSNLDLQDSISLGIYYYNLAICYTTRDLVDSSCYYLRLSLDQWPHLRSFIYIERDFLRLYNTPCWNGVIQKIDSSFLSDYPNIRKRDLAVELYHIYLRDQESRGLHFKNTFLNQDSIDSINLKRVEEIISDHGWPTYSLVGEEASKGAFLVIQHANVQVQQKYLKLLFDAALNNEASKEWVALLIDRISVMRKGIQIFGTQVYQVKDSINEQVITYKYFPIRDESQVDSLRKEFDMIPLKEYYEKYGITYLPMTK